MVCFVENCKFSPKHDSMYERLNKLGTHFIEVHSFKQDAYRYNSAIDPIILLIKSLPRKCNICNLDFAEERKYNSHMRKHDESFQCEKCKRKITGRLWWVKDEKWVCLKISANTLCRFERHQKECEGDERPKWAREAPVLNPGEDKEV